MPNGMDLSVILQTGPLFVPTHLFLVNLDEGLHERVESLVKTLSPPGLTVIHAHEGPRATVTVGQVSDERAREMLPDLGKGEVPAGHLLAKARYNFHRPAILKRIREELERWRQEQRHNRTVFIYLAQPSDHLKAVLLSELPTDVNALFFRRYGSLPLTMRLLLAPVRRWQGPEDDPLALCLDFLNAYYFHTPHSPGDPYASDFDLVVWLEPREEVWSDFLAHILRLQAAEFEALASFKARPLPRKALIIEHLMKAEREKRRLDWLSLCSYPYIPRLWEKGPDALLDLLDFRRQPPNRKKNPWAHLEKMKREASWKGHPLADSFLRRAASLPYHRADIARYDFPFRVSPHDDEGLCEAAIHLSRHKRYSEAEALMRPVVERNPDEPRYLKALGTALYLSGRKEEGGALLLRAISLLTERPYTAHEADEVGGLYLLLGDFRKAVEWCQKAIELDPTLLHAYQGIILAYQRLGDARGEKHWRSKYQEALRKLR